jgi:hypothetical protein
MSHTRDDQSAYASAQTPGRRDVLRSLGTMGLALLGTLGLTEASAARNKRQRKRKKRKPAPSATPVARAGEFVEGSGASSFATCNPGEHAVGGGFEVFNADFSTVTAIQNRSRDSVDGDVPRGWFARIAGGGDAMGIQAYVICVPD